MREWLGLGRRQLALGIDIADGGVRMAVARPGGVITALGCADLAAGAVVGGDVRVPEPVVDAVDRMIGRVHGAPAAPLVAVVPPAVDAETSDIVEAPVYSAASAVGVARARRRTVEGVGSVLRRAGRTLTTIETTPLAGARFARLASADELVQFVRAADGRRRWTVCDDGALLEVEVTEAGGSCDLRAGGELSDLAVVDWGELELAPPVRSAFPEPSGFAPAVGAALGALGFGPQTDLTGPFAQVSDDIVPAAGWGVETVR